MWIKEKVWTRKCEFFFWKFAVSRNKTLTEGIMLSVKVFLRRVFFLCREPNLQALGEFNGRRRPWRLRLRSRQPNPSPRAEGRKLSAKVLFTVGQSFAESWRFGSRRSFQLSVKTLFPVVNAYVSTLCVIQVIYRSLTRQHSTGWYFIIT
jgi:hypothetical protein